MKNQLLAVQFLEDHLSDERTFEKGSCHTVILQDGILWISARPGADITRECTLVVNIPAHVVRIIGKLQPAFSQN